MSNPMGVRRSTYVILLSGFALGALCFMALPKGTLAHAQTKPPVFPARTISVTSTSDIAGLEKLDAATTDLVNFVQPGVVQIFSQSAVHHDLMGNMLPSVDGEGSGLVYRPDGYILTNDHVVGGFDKVTVVLADGHRLEGTVTRAPDMDLAVVKVDAKDLQTLPFADSSKVRPGQFAMAVGSPFGLDATVTFGHISAIGRTRTIPDDRLQISRDYPDLIQTDTPINMGNSGGPLINVRGEVVGINTAIYSPTGSSSGIGFAIPSNTVRVVADRLIQDGKLERGALGVAPATLEPYKAKEMGIDGGATVARIDNGTPAADAGIKLNDVIVRVGNIPVKVETDVRDAMLSYAPGEKVEVEVIRGKDHKVFNVVLTSPDKLPDARKVETPTPEQLDPTNPFQGLNIPGFGNGGNPARPPSTVPHTGNAKLGVTVEDITPLLRKTYTIPAGTKGAVVTGIANGTAAEQIGLQPGDVIQQLGGKAVDSAQALRDVMANRKWGEACTIRFSRFSGNTSASEELPFTF
jgi:serine protease Do